MKLYKYIGILAVGLGVSLSATAQNQQPTMNQSTSTTETRGSAQDKKAIQDKKMLKDPGLKQRQRREQINDGRPANEPIDDRRPANEQRRLRPDSLRRGGATSVDTLRR
ncbi:hypothetical protein [Tellurirhabdus bombi]|uniref:hypothetical protein n=1 Tax=Tellurirhabdus bombi TaxID=2907205 RepID=UPI001F3F034D|nr:hypothetical protein [Tellurirhabdus bombi]